MATGGVFLTEDDLSCEICFDLYTDPKALKCLHTFCGGCISQLAGNRRMVECPNCREKTHMTDLRKDFRIQKLLDQHLGQVVGTSASAGDSCGMCKKKGLSIQMYCADCEKLLCIMCCRIHADIKDIANHATMSKAELTKKYRSKLQTKLNLLHTHKKRVSIKVNNLDSDLSRLQQEQGKLMKSVDKEIDKAIDELNKTRLELHKMIVVSVSDTNLVERLKTSRAECMKEKTDICTNITQVRELMDKDDIFMLKKRLITEQLSSPLPALIRINFDKFPSVKVVTGSWRPHHEKVKVVPIDDHEIAGGSAIRNKVPVNDHELPDYSALKNNEYVQVKTVSTEFSIDRAKIIDDKLYCVCGEDDIEVYDQNCEYITSIYSDNFGVVTGVAESGTGDLIVSCAQKEIYEPWQGDDGEIEQFFRYIQGGLHQVTLQGIKVTSVTPVKEGYLNDKGRAEGEFYDVCVYNGIVYGLTGSGIQQFQLKNSEYVQVGTIDLKTKYSRMCINNEHIFLLSYSSHCGKIFVYNKETQNTQEITNQSQSNWDPRVCSADHHSNVLVVDRRTNSVYVYYKNERKWHEVLSVGNCLQKYEFIKDAVVDERGDNIWVGTTSNKRLIKFSKK